MKTLQRSISGIFRFVIVIGIVLLIPVASARADIGPKPSMEFSFEYEIEPVTIVGGQLIECEDAACETGQPLETVGPQDFTCTENECSSLSYGYAPYHKLVIEFEDRTRESNIFTKQASDASFSVTVSEMGLDVEEVRGDGGSCCSGLMFTLVLETLVASAYLSLFRLPRAALGWVPLSSLLSLPVVWLVFPQLPFSAGLTVALSETFAVLFETGLIYLVARRLLPLKHVAALSLLMNGISFLFGLALATLRVF
ncbi:MAG: hypothetical protein U9R15_04165 [Chloroflexota bacterium]|nr:hypothetical protein [Chloroflexota bacterium]